MGGDNTLGCPEKQAAASRSWLLLLLLLLSSFHRQQLVVVVDAPCRSVRHKLDQTLAPINIFEIGVLYCINPYILCTIHPSQLNIHRGTGPLLRFRTL